MGELCVLPDLGQLKTWGAMDKKCHNEIVAALESKGRILILAGKNSGKNTLQHAIVNHMHRLHKDPFVIPPVEGVPSKCFHSNKKMADFKRLIKKFDSCVASIQYLGSDKADISGLVDFILPDFDLIVDLRNLDGQRVVCNLIKGRKNPSYFYTNSKFKKFIAA